MKERSNNKNEIIKTRDFLQETTKKLGYSKDINGKSKRSHEEVV